MTWILCAWHQGAFALEHVLSEATFDRGVWSPQMVMKSKGISPKSPIGFTRNHDDDDDDDDNDDNDNDDHTDCHED